MFFSFLGGFILWCYGLVGWFGSVSLICYAWLDYPLYFLLDDVSLICSYMLLCCGLMALFYCFHYFSSAQEGHSLFPLMIWFLGTMLMLVFSSCVVVSLILWEYLGLVSFLLILFYSNGVSLRASLITLFASRFGDVGLFMLILWVSKEWFLVGGWQYSLFLLLIILTKSACYPFISWLLEAMRAPTPVSSLVHSSTLVAAGVWFLLRYDSFFSGKSYSLLVFISLLTMLITGTCACFFMDLKKMVALSTCNKISWCLLFYLCGDFSLCLLQLLTHGVSKCYLFMFVGDLMSVSSGSQSSVGVYLSRYLGAYGIVGQGVLMVSLCGLPFLGVFFSKHVFFSGLFCTYGVSFMIFLLTCFFVSYVYSIRFVLLLFRLSGGLSSGYSSSFMLMAGVSFLGTLLNYSGSYMLAELTSMSACWSGLMSVLQLLGASLGCLFFLFNLEGGFWEAFLWGSDCLVGGVYSSFLKFSENHLLSLYRWELYPLSLYSLPATLKGFRYSLFSMNFLVCGFLLSLFLYFLLFTSLP
uniref:NADH dehydrogenase subunit 5 n=1 Tax=Creptotrematina aguirrepequenoi TaxID=985756 RepID=UPI003001A127|nr:NADH dehydrogenase subunit 5 [Creptotrematina aguirrepequenoi]